MDYKDTLEYLYNSAPMFQQIGAGAYKEGLETTRALDRHFGRPHRLYRTIHVAGTNGKGSCSHTLAAVLQCAGYRVGLYTSPHLVDFRERIRVNGVPVPQDYVVRFVEEERAFFEPLHPSFFELATALALKYFADAQVDVAVIEVGLGGRLDCTNIICPDVSLVTNISLDHTQFLGNTLAQIAGEKAGIFKEGVPAVVGETTPETRPVFEQKARDARVASLHFAEDENHEADYPCLEYELKGLYQEKNRRTLLTVLPILREAGYRFTEADVRKGFAHVTELTGLMGRWQRLRERPTVVCDTGHNVGGMAYLARQLRAQHCRRLRIVLGMVNDKDVRGVLALLPQEADYYFAQASVRRALPATEMARLGHEAGLRGSAWPDVPAAVRAALKESLPEDFIFVGGSTFVVADLLANRDALNLY